MAHPPDGGADGGPHAGASDPIRLGERWAEREAAAERRRRSLIEQAAGAATMAGVLLDLAEHGTAVRVGLRCGTTLAGHVETVGVDYWVLGDRLGCTWVVPMARTGRVESVEGGPLPLGFRAPASTVCLRDALESLAERQPRVRAAVDGHRQRAGSLTRMATDHLVIDTSAGPLVVNLAALRWLAVGSAQDSLATASG